MPAMKQADGNPYCSACGGPISSLRPRAHFTEDCIRVLHASIEDLRRRTVDA